MGDESAVKELLSIAEEIEQISSSLNQVSVKVLRTIDKLTTK